MFLLVITLMLINTYSGSLGNPIPTSSVLNDLSLLAKSCYSPFLMDQIKNNKQCSGEKLTNEELFQCLMFYDINTQLCNSSKKVSIDENQFKTIMEGTLEVNKVCELAKSWKTSELPKYSNYKMYIDKILSAPTKCSPMCDIDVFTEEANYFCKYYNWGSSILKNMEAEETKPVNNAEAPLVTSEDAKIKEPSTSSNPSGSSLQPAVSEVSKIKPVAEQNPAKIPAENENLPPIVPKPEPSPSALGVSAAQQMSGPQAIESKVNIVDNQDLQVPIKEPKAPVLGEEAPKADIDGPPIDEEENMPPIKDNEDIVVEKPKQEVKTEDKIVNQAELPIGSSDPQTVLKKPALEDVKPKQPKTADEDYQDSDEGKDGLGDIQGGDDGDDPMVGDLDLKPNLLPNSNSAKRVESPVSNGEISQREFYPNSIPDDFADDDDHFFPLFLTAIVFVVLLYVLYHNKSKVTKLVLGLIVEGRQPGRRRNSRGHAYRRLDTLEQAMNTNTAAPPSKIIY